MARARGPTPGTSSPAGIRRSESGRSDARPERYEALCVPLATREDGLHFARVEGAVLSRADHVLLAVRSHLGRGMALEEVDPIYKLASWGEIAEVVQTADPGARLAPLTLSHAQPVGTTVVITHMTVIFVDAARECADCATMNIRCVRISAIVLAFCAVSTTACAPDGSVDIGSESQEVIFPTTRLQPPQLVAPLSSSLVSTRTPTLRWRYPAAGPRSAVLVCRDRACRQVERALLATGDAVALSSPLAPGVHFWCVVQYSGLLRSARTSPVWEFRVGARSAPVESASGHYADFNGDGFSDLAVPASQVNGLATQALVYFGRASGLSSTPDQVLTGPVGYTGDLGWFQNTFRLDAGDLNGDGFTDLAVASAGPGRDQVFVYYGGAAGLQTTPATTLVGQLPPDGSLTDGLQSEFGVAMTPAGDVNGDGYADLAITEIGRREGPRGAGFVHVYQGRALGIAATPTLTLGPSYETGRVTEGLELDVGFKLASGDLDADGLSDIVASTDVPPGGHNTLRVFEGASGGPSYAAQTVLLNPTHGGRPGVMAYGVAVGDVNGDGYGDAVTSLSGTGGAFPQHTYLTFAGGASGVSLTPVSSVLVTPAVYFSRANLVAGGGDVNGDGYGDAVVRTGDASLLTLRGGAAGLAIPGDGGVLPCEGANGSVLARATIEHDFNNDGYADLHYGDRVHLGSSAGLALAPSVTLAP